MCGNDVNYLYTTCAWCRYGKMSFQILIARSFLNDEYTEYNIGLKTKKKKKSEVFKRNKPLMRQISPAFSWRSSTNTRDIRVFEAF